MKLDRHKEWIEKRHENYDAERDKCYIKREDSKISKNGLSRLVHPRCSLGHFWKVQRESDRPCESAFEPRSVRGILIGQEKAGDEDGRKRRRKRRRWRRKGAKKVETNKNLTSVPLCERNHLKRSRWRTAVWLPEGHREKRIVKRKRDRDGKCVSRVADKFPDGKTRCADRAPACHHISFPFCWKVYNSTDCKFLKAS